MPTALLHLGKSMNPPKLSFAEKETRCEILFRDLQPCWHLHTPEDFEIIFSSDEDFKAGMLLIALCAMSFPDIKIPAFQLMSNHLHITLSGSESESRAFFRMFKHRLQVYLKGLDRTVGLSRWEEKLIAVEDLDYLRTVIVYTNRNGFLVNANETPFTYQWGTSRLFFNPDATKLHALSAEKLTVRKLRSVIHSGAYDHFAGYKMIDGYISPSAYCDIAAAMALFRDAHQYFYMISRDIEGQQRIAAELGELISYTDNELFAFVVSICRKDYGIGKPSMIPSEAKLALARKMHFEYNATEKQISRILHLDRDILRAMFASSR